MIPYLPLAFSKINSKSILFSLLVLSYFQAKSQYVLPDTLINKRAYPELWQYIQTQKPEQTTLIIFASSHTCTTCYRLLENQFKRNQIAQNCRIILMVRLVNNIAMRRDFVKKYPLFTYADTTIFEDSPDGQLLETNPVGGLFGALKIQYSPAILCMQQGKITYWSNTNIFTPSMRITKPFKKAMRNTKGKGNN